MSTTTEQIIQILTKKGIKATYGDEDNSSVISWDDVQGIKDALKDVPDVVIRPGIGYDRGTIIHPK